MHQNTSTPLQRHPVARAIATAFAIVVTLGAFSPNTLAQVENKVLILGPTVSGGASSREAQAAVAAGMTVEVVDNAGWAAKTQADFAKYRALILGDATCTGLGAVTAANSNKSVWGPVINGNVIIIGTDPVYHNFQGGQSLTNGGVKFAVDKPGKTGMYITLSCYYHDTAPMTAVPLLDAFSPGGFTVRGVGCYNNAHIVATHPALTGITDATLSGWSCSVHEGFDKWPVDFQVLAIARDIGSSFTASDGSVGTPYILARGVTVISDIKLTPLTAENTVGVSHTLTATTTTDSPSAGTPVVGATVTFSIISGPNAGTTGTGVTNASGQTTFTYSSSVEGTDFIKATFIDSTGKTQTSDTVTAKWVKPANNPPVALCRNVTVAADNSCSASASVNNGSYDPDAGDSITVTQLPAGPYPLGATLVTLTVTDSKGASSSCSATVTVVDNSRPAIICPANVTQVGNIIGSCSANVNPGVATANDSCSTPTVVGVRSDGQPLTAPYPSGIVTITWTAKDAAGNTSSCVSTVTVTNIPPVATITGPASGAVFAVGTPVTFTGSYTDNPGGTHTAQWMFDAVSKAGTVDETAKTVTASHTFSTAGVYMIKLTVFDGCGEQSTASTVGGLDAMVVIYDPNGGFVTGGGWINSPAGAYTADTSLTGRANFGFVSKYQQGASTPTGETEFQFKVGNLNFHSTSYDWLVIAGARAQYKGSGTINGSGDYAFLLTAIDGQINGGGGVDKLRMKIWNKSTGAIIYDNQIGAADGADPVTALGGGSIVIHK